MRDAGMTVIRLENVARGAILQIGDGEIDTETIEMIDGGETDFGTHGTVTNTLQILYQQGGADLHSSRWAFGVQPAR